MMYGDNNPGVSEKDWVALCNRVQKPESFLTVQRACGAGFLTPADFEFSEPMTAQDNRRFLAALDANMGIMVDDLLAAGGVGASCKEFGHACALAQAVGKER